MSSFWTPSSGRLYLPPPTPITKILHTDDFVRRTQAFYHAKSERLLMVGHPYYEIRKPITNEVLVPKVSSCQYRVFRVSLPDPNTFAFPDPNIYDVETERLVWRLQGLEIGRGLPLGISSVGHPFFNKFFDTENVIATPEGTTDDRQNTSFDPKQMQMFIVGCQPCQGEYWEKTTPCVGGDAPPPEPDACPPLELKTNTIQDGFMCDIGLGAMNFKSLQETRSGATLDTVTEICYYPDFLKMTDDSYGNSCFFYGKREQLYSRHFFTRGGVTGDDIPSDLFLSDASLAKKQGPIAYFNTPSGSLVSSESQIMNRPYWLQRAQGTNNGMCWGNELFITVVDNTRGTNFTISVRTGAAEDEGQPTYNSTKFKQYNRHCEEYELSFIFELCVVTLTPEVLAHIHTMDKKILDDWNLGFIAPPGTLEDKYRYLGSQAVKCATDVPPSKPEDPYAGMNFWKVDLTQKFSSDLEQHALGRKFLFQANLRPRKRAATKKVSFKSSGPAKKRRKTAN